MRATAAVQPWRSTPYFLLFIVIAVLGALFLSGTIQVAHFQQDAAVVSLQVGPSIPIPVECNCSSDVKPLRDASNDPMAENVENSHDEAANVDAAAKNAQSSASEHAAALPGASWKLPLSAMRVYTHSTATWLNPNDATSAGLSIDPAQFRLHIKVLTFDRLESLHRCLNSLANAYYDSDPVSLDIILDNPYSRHKPWTDGVQEFSMEDEEHIGKMHSILASLSNFTWPHGPKRVMYRWQNAGLQAQWIEAWYPDNPNEMAFIVEDDLEVSPLYYKYLKRLVAHYYFDPSNFDPRVFGLSFQRQWFVPGIGGARILRKKKQPFLYGVVGTWGQVLFPLAWREFRMWYDVRRHNASQKAVVYNFKSTDWYLGKGDRIWTPWMIKWAYVHSMFNLYPVLPGKLALSVSYRAAGSTYKDNSRGADSTLVRQLQRRDGSEEWWRAELPPMPALTRYDMCYHPLRQLAASTGVDEFRQLVKAVHRNHRIALIVVPPNSRDLAVNWACHARAVAGVSNAILIVSSQDSALVDQLLAAGHAVHVVVSDQQQLQPGSGNQQSAADGSLSLQHQAAVAELVAVALSGRFEVLSCSADTVWFGDPVGAAAASLPQGYDMGGYASKGDIFSSLLFARASKSSIRAWKALASDFGEAKNSGRGGMQYTAASWIENQSKKKLKFLDMPTLQATPGKNVTWPKRSLPIVIPRDMKQKEETPSWLKSRKLWLVQDHDHACTVAFCERK